MYIEEKGLNPRGLKYIDANLKATTAGPHQFDPHCYVSLNKSKRLACSIYMLTDYFGTQQIIFSNNMNTIGNHFLYQVRGQISCIYD